MNSYSMEEASRVGDRGVEAVIKYLSKIYVNPIITDVQNDKEYQGRGIDLLVDKGFGDKIFKLEVKTDRHHKTGNFFMETVSNMSTGTLGWMFYTACDYLFYVFDNIEIHIIHMPSLIAWFKENYHKYQTRRTSTSDLYQTEGVLVPVAVLRRDLKDKHKVIRIAP